MPVYRRDRSPHWVIEFEYQGLRYRRSSGTSRKSKALSIEAKWRQELLDEAIHGRREPLALSQALERYYKSVLLPRGKLASAKRHLHLMKRILTDLGPETRLEKLTTPVLSRWRDDLLAAGRKPATVNRHLDLLKATLNRAAREWGALATAPFVRSLPEKNQRTRFLSDEEEARLLAASPPYLRSLLVFLLGTGARVGEALDLVWRDVDLERPPNGVAFFLETKSDKPRGIPLTRVVHATLAELAKQRSRRSDFVFTRPDLMGQRLDWDAVKTAFRRTRERARLRDVTLHTLRHTYASRLVLRGVSLYQVQKLLGHSSPIMTQRYAHLAPDALAASVAVLDRVPSHEVASAAEALITPS
ncbi:MAG TPA: hypothetical protein DEP35_07280 [Deltaproteobacteria bacterium]|nr:hypothetical protein [Deltaproteobacteria bacterium]